MLTVKDLEVGKTYSILSGKVSDEDMTINNPFKVSNMDDSGLIYSKDSMFEGKPPYPWDEDGWCIIDTKIDINMTFVEVK
jgi:hypothetical protein